MIKETKTLGAEHIDVQKLAKLLDDTPRHKLGVIICYTTNPLRWNIEYYDNCPSGYKSLLETLKIYVDHNAFVNDVYVIIRDEDMTRYFNLDNAIEFYTINEPFKYVNSSTAFEDIDPVYINNFDLEFYSKDIDLTALDNQVLCFRYNPNRGPGCETIEIGFNENIKKDELIAYPKLLELLHSQREVRIRLVPKKVNGMRTCIFEFKARLERLSPLEFDYTKNQDIMKIETIWNQVKY